MRNGGLSTSRGIGGVPVRGIVPTRGDRGKNPTVPEGLGAGMRPHGSLKPGQRPLDARETAEGGSISPLPRYDLRPRREPTGIRSIAGTTAAAPDVPAARIDRMPASSESDPLADLALDTASEGESIDLSEASILLVDDNVQNLELIQAYLEALPCSLQVAHDGVEAMEQVARHRPDLVLLDVMMPRMSGFEVCRRIKSNPETRHTLVIMVTALNEVADYERAVESGTDDFLSKPVNKLELLTRIRSLLRVALLRRKLDRLVGRRDAEGD